MDGFPLVYTYFACPYVGIIQIRLRVGVSTSLSACCDEPIGKLPCCTIFCEYYTSVHWKLQTMPSRRNLLLAEPMNLLKIRRFYP